MDGALVETDPGVQAPPKAISSCAMERGSCHITGVTHRMQPRKITSAVSLLVTLWAYNKFCFPPSSKPFVIGPRADRD
jgi:hypothetical protein